MEVQIPAEGIMKHGDYGDSKFYEIACSCGQQDHAHQLMIEASGDDITVTINTTVTTDWWSDSIKVEFQDTWQNSVLRFAASLANGLVRRIKLTWQVWAVGYVKYQADTIMNEQQALNYAATLNAAIVDVKQFRTDRIKK